MKQKLTLAVEKPLIEFGKQYAARHGTSLSRLMEEALRKLADAAEPPFSQKWRGKLTKAQRPGDQRMELLERRYG